MISFKGTNHESILNIINENLQVNFKTSHYMRWFCNISWIWILLSICKQWSCTAAFDSSFIARNQTTKTYFFSYNPLVRSSHHACVFQILFTLWCKVYYFLTKQGSETKNVYEAYVICMPNENTGAVLYWWVFCVFIMNERSFCRTHMPSEEASLTQSIQDIREHQRAAYFSNKPHLPWHCKYI